jgi:putative ABC transport system permease protein
MTKNNLEKLKDYIDDNTVIKDNATDIKYIYNAKLNAFTLIKNNTGEVVGSFENLSGLSELMTEIGLGSMSNSMASMDMMGTAAWTELVGSLDHIKTQYELVDGRFPTKEGETSEVVLIVDQYNQVTDFILYTLGIRNIQELRNWVADQMNPNIKDEDKTKIESPEFSTSDLLGYEFMVLPDSERFYLGQNGEILERDNLSEFVISENTTAKKVKIVGIVTPTDDSLGTSAIGSIGYTNGLMAKIIEKSNQAVC